MDYVKVASRFVTEIKYFIAKANIKGRSGLEKLNEYSNKFSNKLFAILYSVIFVLSIPIILSNKIDKCQMFILQTLFIIICGIYAFQFIYNSLIKLRWHIFSAFAILVISPYVIYLLNINGKHDVDSLFVYGFFVIIYSFLVFLSNKEIAEISIRLHTLIFSILSVIFNKYNFESLIAKNIGISSSSDLEQLQNELTIAQSELLKFLTLLLAFWIWFNLIIEIREYCLKEYKIYLEKTTEI